MQDEKIWLLPHRVQSPILKSYLEEDRGEPCLNLVDLAQKIVRFFEQKEQRFFYRREQQTDLFEFLGDCCQKHPNFLLYEIYRLYQQGEILNAFPLSFEDLVEIKNSLEELKSEESHSLSLFLIFLEAKIFFHQKQTIHCAWNLLDLAIQALERHQSIEIDALFPGGVSFRLPQHLEAFPLETRFLAELKKYFPIEECFMATHSGDLIPLPLESGTLSEAAPVIFIGNPSKPMDPLMFSYLYLGPELRAFRAPRLQENDFAATYQLGQNLKSASDPQDFILRLRGYLEEEQKDSTFLERLYFGPNSSASDWLKVLIDKKIFAKPVDGLDNQFWGHFSGSGVKVFSWKDLAFFQAEAQLYFCFENEEYLADFYDPYSQFFVEQKILSPLLIQELERLQFVVPDPTRDIQRLYSCLNELAPRSKRLEVRPSVVPAVATEDSPVVSHEDLPTTFSPSWLESFQQCSYKTYLGRVLRLQNESEADPDRLTPLSKGNWIHAVLEDFFRAPDWNTPHELIQDLFREKIDLYFSKISPSYKKTIYSHSLFYTRLLSRYLQSFEKEFQALFPERSLLLEEKITGTYGRIPIAGKIDRIDLLAQDQAFLWDYKSGQIQQSSALTQIKNGKFQWFLYRELLNKNLLAGGYLQPLQPSQSYIFMFEAEAHDPRQKELRRLLGSLSMGYEVIDAEQDQTLRERLRTHLDTLYTTILEKQYTPEPVQSAQCERCEFISACGRSYFVEEHS